jgi:hypothetical protein
VTGERFALSFNTSAAIGGPIVETPPGLPKDPTLFGRFTLGQAESIDGRQGLRLGEFQPRRRSGRLDAVIGTIRSVLDAGESS